MEEKTVTVGQKLFQPVSKNPAEQKEKFAFLINKNECLNDDPARKGTVLIDLQNRSTERQKESCEKPLDPSVVQDISEMMTFLKIFTGGLNTAKTNEIMCRKCRVE